MAVLSAPFLFFIFFRDRTLPDHALVSFPADLLSFVVPGSLVALSADRVGAANPTWANGSAYLGPPLLFLVAAFGWYHRERPAARVALVTLAIGVVGALGKDLVVGGHRTGLLMPWTVLGYLPLLRYAIPLRFTVFAFLAAAVIVALWLSWRPSTARWVLAVLVVASFTPAIGSRAWSTHLVDPPFFTGHQAALQPTDHVLVVPARGRSMRWQARAGFGFGLAAGYVGASPASYTRYPLWNKLLAAGLDPDAGRVTAASKRALRSFVRDKGVTAIVVEQSFVPAWRPLFDTLNVPGRTVDGVLLYRLRAPPRR